MTDKEKAEEIVNLVAAEISFNGQTRAETYEDAKNIALICVNQIVEALEDFGRESDELQNMESNFRFWDSVKSKIVI